MDYIWGLDPIRFAAAAMVVLFHLTWHRTAPAFTMNGGWVGVEIFFVISGFVIVGSAQHANAVDFLRKRVLRLYPAAIGCAVLSYAVLWLGQGAAASVGVEARADIPDLLRSMLLVEGPYLVSALWTLPIELAFYGLVAVLLAARRIQRFDVLAALLTLWTAPYIVLFAFHIYGMTSLRVGSLGYGLLNLTLLRHGCFFGLGMMLWVAAHRPMRRWWPPMIVIALLLCSIEIVARAREVVGQYAYPVQVEDLAAEALSAFAICVMAIWCAAIFNRFLVLGYRTRRTIRLVGLMTYPLYLCHEAIGGTMLGALGEAGVPQPLALAAAIAAALGVSYLVATRLEPLTRRYLRSAIGPTSRDRPGAAATKTEESGALP